MKKKNPFLVAALVVSIVVVIVSAAFIIVELRRWLDSNAVCDSLPSHESLKAMGAAQRIESEREFDLLTRSNKTGRSTEALKAMVVCFNGNDATSGSLFFASERYELHFDFADQVLHVTSSRITFDRLAYFSGASRTIIVATLLRTAPGEFSLQFWPTDDMSANDIIRTYVLMRDAIQPWARKLTWVPGGEAQRRRAAANAAAFRDAGIVIEYSLTEARHQVVYNGGSSVGYLRRGEANQFDAHSIVLFAGNAPPDISRVAGIISARPQSPLSHTNVRAVHNKVPNVYVADAVARFDQYVDKPVRLTASDAGDSVSLEPATPDELAAAIANRSSAPLQLPVPRLDLVQCMPLDTLRAVDANVVGTKAANVAELLRVRGLSVDIPRGFAVPFGLFQRHMSHMYVGADVVRWNVSDDTSTARQTVLEALVGNDTELSLWNMTGRALALRKFADSWLLSGNATFDWRAQQPPFNHPGVLVLLNDTTGDARGGALALTVMRAAIRAAPPAPTIDAALDTAVAEFANGASLKSLRCRSSGSAEDLVDFSGAGLYDSYTHKFSTGQPISATVKRVWASFLTLRAVAERDAAGIDHRNVYMGVLVHPNYGTEQANGVAVTANLLGPRPFPYDARDVFINAQYGEVSVVNPPLGKDGVAPSPDVFVSSVLYNVNNYDALSSLRKAPSATVLSDDEAFALARDMITIHRHFLAIYAERQVCAFDLEWKVQASADNTARGRLAIKQVRPMAWGADSCAVEATQPPDRLGSGDTLSAGGIAAFIFFGIALVSAVLLASLLFCWPSAKPEASIVARLVVPGSSAAGRTSSGDDEDASKEEEEEQTARSESE